MGRPVGVRVPRKLGGWVKPAIFPAGKRLRSSRKPLHPNFRESRLGLAREGDQKGLARASQPETAANTGRAIQSRVSAPFILRTMTVEAGRAAVEIEIRGKAAWDNF